MDFSKSAYAYTYNEVHALVCLKGLFIYLRSVLNSGTQFPLKMFLGSVSHHNHLNFSFNIIIHAIVIGCNMCLVV